MVNDSSNVPERMVRVAQNYTIVEKVIADITATPA